MSEPDNTKPLSARSAFHLGAQREKRGDCAGAAAAAAFWIALDWGKTDVWFSAALGLTLVHGVIPADPVAARLISLLKLAQVDAKVLGAYGAQHECQPVIASGHPEFAPIAAVHLGQLREDEDDLPGAAAAYQIAVASGHPYWAPRAAHYLAALDASGGQE